MASGLALLLSGVSSGGAHADPVRCTTTIEAPLIRSGEPLPLRTGPREVTRCGVVGSTSEFVEQRFYSYRSPYARGVSITHQLADLFGLAFGGRDGAQFMGFGFPDQAIVWDGSAIENTNSFLMNQQVQLVPRRTADLSTPFSTSIRGGAGSGEGVDAMAYPSPAMGSR